jgi:hypothetical protein
MLQHGQTAFVLLGVNASETQSSIDAALTFAILWLDLCRESSAGKYLVEGLVLFVPAGSSALVRERMADLNPAAAKWRLFEFDDRDDSVVEGDCTDRGQHRDSAGARHQRDHGTRQVRRIHHSRSDHSAEL